MKKVLDGEETFPYNTYCVLLKNEEVSCHENDVSAQEETEIQGSWFQSQNEQRRRKKGPG